MSSSSVSPCLRENLTLPARAAIIGISGYGAVHLKHALAAADRGEITLAAATVINQDAEAENCARLRQLGCRIFADYREMLAEFHGNLDLCLIPTGIAHHEPMTIAALAAGARVLVEKPLTGHPDSTHAILAAQNNDPTRVAVGFQHVYLPGFHYLRQQIQTGQMGTLRRIDVFGCWPRGHGYYARNAWAGRLTVQGTPIRDSPLNNAFAHAVNVALCLAAESPDTAATTHAVHGQLYRANDIESFDTAYVSAELDRGVIASFALTHASQAECPLTVAVTCDDGNFSWNMATGAVSGQLKPNSPLALNVGDGYATNDNSFGSVLRWAKFGGLPACTTQMAARHVDLIDLLHRSCSIQNVAPRHIQNLPLGDSWITTIANIDLLLKTAHTNHNPLPDLAT